MISLRAALDAPPPIDLAEVRDARAELAAIARAHPELVGPRSPENRAAWETTLAAMEDTMPEETKQVGFRLPVSLIDKMDAYAEKMTRDQPGLSFTRADVARVLLTRALQEDEPATKADTKAKPQKGAKAPRKAK